MIEMTLGTYRIVFCVLLLLAVTAAYWLGSFFGEKDGYADGWEDCHEAFDRMMDYLESEYNEVTDDEDC